jgi:hypothetical protein
MSRGKKEEILSPHLAHSMLPIHEIAPVYARDKENYDSENNK